MSEPFSPSLADGGEEDAPPGPGHVIPSGPEATGRPDLTTRYLGFELRTPVVASAGPFTGDLPSLRALDAAGVGAVVLPSLFEEQLAHDAEQVERLSGYGSEANPEAASGYVPNLDHYNEGSVRYLRLIREAKEAVRGPVIASLNGVSAGGWVRYAKLLADAGADAIELNVYRVAADATDTGRQVEQETLRLVEAVAEATEVPVAVKLSPYWSALANFATQLADAGADGLVLFNRFYQPDINLETLSVAPHLVLSDSDELRLPLRWCAILHGRVEASLAATTGVHTAHDVIKLLLAGADVTMSTSALLRHGPEHVATLNAGVSDWLEARGYGSVEQLRGAVSQRTVRDPAAFERANYLETLTRYASTFLR
ncbi:MAG: dihydroorotate dehydrogenase-like protein [Nitriliruptoraceae bacterium]